MYTHTHTHRAWIPILTANRSNNTNTRSLSPHGSRDAYHSNPVRQIQSARDYHTSTRDPMRGLSTTHANSNRSSRMSNDDIIESNNIAQESRHTHAIGRQDAAQSRPGSTYTSNCAQELGTTSARVNDALSESDNTSHVHDKTRATNAEISAYAIQKSHSAQYADHARTRKNDSDSDPNNNDKNYMSYYSDSCDGHASGGHTGTLQHLTRHDHDYCSKCGEGHAFGGVPMARHRHKYSDDIHARNRHHDSDLGIGALTLHLRRLEDKIESLTSNLAGEMDAEEFGGNEAGADGWRIMGMYLHV
jgi:hypothetical protein